MKGLKDKVFLITGATSGIGQATALRLAQEGVHVIINYRKSEADAQETEAMILDAVCQGVDACGTRRLLFQADVSQPDKVNAMFDEAITTMGRLDGLINNAGIQQAKPAHQLSLEDFDRVIDVNLRGAFHCAQRAIQQFLHQQSTGCIINVSSVHETIPKPEYVSYSVSKGGLRNMTRTLALEYASRHIRVNSIAPGATMTAMNDTWKDNPDKLQEVESHIPMGRVAQAEEMAAAAAFLASDEATYITGQTLFIDGGVTLYPDFQDTWSSD